MVVGETETVAILGGTGPVGRGLAWRWARGGHAVIIGSRSSARAIATATEITEQYRVTAVRGMDNTAAAAAASIVVFTVPFVAQPATLETVRDLLPDKILVDVTVPLRSAQPGTVRLPPEGSAAVAAQRLLGDRVSVVAAFHNVSAEHLLDEHDVDCDVLVTGDSEAARETVISLATAAGLRAWHAGPLANSAAAEALTSVLIHINRRYRIAGAGIRITGQPQR